jgi:uncharacterized protein YjeT (DUF2065 family)
MKIQMEIPDALALLGMVAAGVGAWVVWESWGAGLLAAGCLLYYAALRAV